VIVNPPPGTSSVKVRVEDQPVANPPAQPTTPPAANPCPPAAVRDNAARGNARDDFAGCETQSVPPGGRIIINSQ
jgi:hypothetical protein